jgi:hypothetical protein
MPLLAEGLSALGAVRFAIVPNLDRRTATW